MRLLDYGAYAVLNQRDNEGMTPLMRAARKGAFDNVKTLCAYGASLILRDHDGSTALDLARSAKHQFIVKYLESMIPPQ